jgi:hypothetical protein
MAQKKRYVVVPEVQKAKALRLRDPVQQDVLPRTPNTRQGFSGGTAERLDRGREAGVEPRILVSPGVPGDEEALQDVPGATRVLVEAPGAPGDTRIVWSEPSLTSDRTADTDVVQLRQSPLVAHARNDVLARSRWMTFPQWVKLGDGGLLLLALNADVPPAGSIPDTETLGNTRGPASPEQASDQLHYWLYRGPYQSLVAPNLLVPGMSIGGAGLVYRRFAAAAVPGSESSVLFVNVRADGIAVQVVNFSTQSTKTVRYFPQGRGFPFGTQPWTTGKYRAGTPDQMEALIESEGGFSEHPRDMKLAFLPSGRAVLVCALAQGVVSLVSDDLGVTWREHSVLPYYGWEELHAGREMRDPLGAVVAAVPDIYRMPLHASLDLVRTENGNLFLAVVAPSQTGMWAPRRGSPDPAPVSYVSWTTPAIETSAAAVLGLYSSSDGETWGGGLLEFTDWSHTDSFAGFATVLEAEPPTAWPNPPLMPGRAFSTLLTAQYHFSTSGDKSKTDADFHGVTFDPNRIFPVQSSTVLRESDYNANPGDAQNRWPVRRFDQEGYLPQFVSLSVSSEGYVDIYLTTATPWEVSEYLTGTPPGWVSVGTGLQVPAGRAAGRFLLMHRRVETRDISPSQSPDDWIPRVGETFKRFVVLQTSTGFDPRYDEGGTLGVFGYFGGHAACSWRGRTLLACHTLGQTVSEGVDIGFGVLTLNGWQPLRENLGWNIRERVLEFPQQTKASRIFLLSPGVREVQELPSSRPGNSHTRTYARCWYGQNDPSVMGWIPEVDGVQNSGNVVVAPSVGSGGFAIQVAAANARIYKLSDRLPNHEPSSPDAGQLSRLFDSVHRVVMCPVSGDTIGVRGCFYEVALGSKDANRRAHFILGIVFDDTGTLKAELWRVYNNTGAQYKAAEVDLTGLRPVEGWLEFVISTRTEAQTDPVAPSTDPPLDGQVMHVDVFWRALASTSTGAAEALNQSGADFTNDFALILSEAVERRTMSSGELARGGDLIRFGSQLPSEALKPIISAWKMVSIHRSHFPAVTPAETLFDVRPAPLSIPQAFQFEGGSGNRRTAALIFDSANAHVFPNKMDVVGSGVSHFMRGSTARAGGDTYINRHYGVRTQGSWDIGESFLLKPSFIFDEENVWTNPVGAEWRSKPISNSDGKRVLTFELETPSATWRPEALAVFGRNTPILSFSLVTSMANDYEPSFGIGFPPEPRPQSNLTVVTFVSGLHFSVTPEFQRVEESPIYVDTGLWTNWDPGSDRPVLAATGRCQVRGNRVVYFAPFFPSDAVYPPWRSGRFQSQLHGGPQFYLAVQPRKFANQIVAPGAPPPPPVLGAPQPILVFRIVDNTDSTLVLEDAEAEQKITQLLETLEVNPNNVTYSIFSDRFALSLRDLYVEGEGWEPGDPPLAGSPNYRTAFEFYPMRNQPFHRLGRVMLGSLHDISQPDVDWEWSQSFSSGSTLSRRSDGSVFAVENSPPVRAVSANWPLMESAQRPLTRRGAEGTGKRSWEAMADLLQRLRIDGRECALIWEGDTFNTSFPGAVKHTDQNTSLDNVAKPADPMHLLCVRASAADFGNAVYECRARLLPGGLGASVLPYGTVSGVTFTEEF